MNKGPIGVFDSGYGGLTILKAIRSKLPQYDYLYLGDNARAPYGPRSFNTVYQYTLQCVQWFFKQGCPLVILACNTASAKALRNIQQNDLKKMDPSKRVLGVIRPTTEIIGQFTRNNKVGIFGTQGTVISDSYPIEIEKMFPAIEVFQQACPMWVPLIENNEHLTDGADYFVEKYIRELLEKSPGIDTFLLACTHYPLLLDKIKRYIPAESVILTQGEIVANSLANYLERHCEIENKCTKNGRITFFTTDSATEFDQHGAVFFGENVNSTHLEL